MPTFIDKLKAKWNEGKFVCVGLDADYEKIPPFLKQKTSGDKFPEASAFYEFNKSIIDSTHDLVCAFKINSAFYEAKIETWESMQHTFRYLQTAYPDIPIILDAKRADIGNTSERYALGTLADPQFDSLDDNTGPDAVTLAPYMGEDSVGPFIKVAADEGKGVFILVRTSNPGAAAIQDALLQDGTPVYQHVGKLVAQWGAKLVGTRGYSSVGAVVGATNPDQLAALRVLLPQTIFLVPGYGAQGGSAADVAKAFKPDRTGAIINSSRGIIYAHKSPAYAGMPWERAVEAATLAAKKEIAAALQ